MTETYTITVESLEREVQCRREQSILDACLREGIWLPHACTHGTCATCKVQVLHGEVEHNDASSFQLGRRGRRFRLLVHADEPSHAGRVEMGEGVDAQPEKLAEQKALDDVIIDMLIHAKQASDSR